MTKIGLLQSKKISDCNQSVFFIKKNDLSYILIKQQNILSQSLLVIGPIRFLISSKLLYIIYFRAYGRFDF